MFRTPKNANKSDPSSPSPPTLKPCYNIPMTNITPEHIADAPDAYPSPSAADTIELRTLDGLLHSTVQLLQPHPHATATSPWQAGIIYRVTPYYDNTTGQPYSRAQREQFTTDGFTAADAIHERDEYNQHLIDSI